MPRWQDPFLVSQSPIFRNRQTLCLNLSLLLRSPNCRCRLSCLRSTIGVRAGRSKCPLLPFLPPWAVASTIRPLFQNWVVTTRLSMAFPLPPFRRLCLPTLSTLRKSISLRLISSPTAIPLTGPFARCIPCLSRLLRPPCSSIAVFPLTTCTISHWVKPLLIGKRGCFPTSTRRAGIKLTSSLFSLPLSSLARPSLLSPSYLLAYDMIAP